MRVPHFQDGHNSPEVIDVPPGSAGGRAMMTDPAADAPGTEGAANVHIVPLAHRQCAQTSDLNPAPGQSNKDQRIGAGPGSNRKRVRVIPRRSPLLCTANSRKRSVDAKADECADSIPEIAEGNACYRGEAMAPALQNAPSHYVEDTRSGRHREDEARNQER